MAENHVLKVPLNDRIFRATTKKDQQGRSMEIHVKNGFAVIGIQEYLRCVVEITKDPGLQVLVSEKPFCTSYEQDDTVDRYLNKCFQQNFETCFNQIYELLILPFAKMAENDVWINSGEYEESSVPFD